MAVSNDLSVGFRTLEVAETIIEDLYADDKIKIWDKRLVLYPNMYVELRSTEKEKHTALGKVDTTGEWIKKIKNPEANGLKPRNREQAFALDALMDDSIPVVVLTGSAGTGKTILTMATAMQKIQDKRYSRCIITRPMSQVTKYSFGALPGGIEEKFNPYLANYMTNLEQFTNNRGNIEHMIDQYHIEAIPLQFFRGASFNKCFVIADECQVLNHMDVLTIGTRIGEGSKLVIMGDLNQRDDNIIKEKTGLHKLMNDKKVKESGLVAAICLQKCERSEVARMFAEIFEEK
jgi:PhoH-like ATPase